ncbi:MAG: transglycosylase SLT domain-containing protein [Desulfobulbaceae bacterium]|nr:transglycosylase SLT domain-containing protein [Desulfobulbaceae bacterium]
MKQQPAMIVLLSAHTPGLCISARMCALLAIFIMLFFSPLQGQAAGLFPVYPSIRPNVAFWEDVYSRYTTRQGILHDQDNLAIVYTIVDLVDWNASNSARINKELIKLARQHYKTILADLAEGKKPATENEKRVAAMFPPNSHHAFRKARDNIRLQIGQKDRFLEGVIRSGAYMPDIKKIFSAYKLPTELAYLPHVESSFNPDAHSKAGAAGLWQFTRSTGKQYMQVDDVVDLRYDPYYAARAAAVFLQGNFEALGSWPMAITAYNHGRNGMLRAAREYDGYEQIFNNYESRLFRFASRNFYSEFIAAVNVARRLENDRNIILDRPEATIMVRMEGFARAEDIRSHFRLSEEDFTRLNPALRKPVLQGKKFIPKNLHVRIPANAQTRDLASAIPSRLYHSRQIRDQEYIVRRGDTAGSIARKYRISLAELVRANNLNSNAMIRIGQPLKIPSGASENKNIQMVVLEPTSKIKPN